MGGSDLCFIVADIQPPSACFQYRSWGRIGLGAGAGGGAGCGGAKNDQGAAPPLEASGLAICLGKKMAPLEGRPRMEKKRIHEVRL